MDRRLLLCDDGTIGKLMKKQIDNFRFETVLCRNTVEITEKELEKGQFDAVLMFIDYDSEENYSFIRRTLEKHPEIKIFAALCVDSEAIKRKISEAGIHRYMIMPLHPVDVCNLLIEEFTPFEDELVIDVIARFLMRKCFARHLQGFIFLCIAVENCLEKPRLLSALEDQLYPYIAELTLTTPEYVDKSLQRLTDNALKRGFTFFSYKGGSHLSNREIIAACADEFADRHLKHLYKTNPLTAAQEK